MFVWIDKIENIDWTINEEKLDIVLRFGSGILRGKILDLFKFGFISIHHGDNREYRGTPAGFWEVFHSSPSTGFIIQKLNYIVLM